MITKRRSVTWLLMLSGLILLLVPVLAPQQVGADGRPATGEASATVAAATKRVEDAWELARQIGVYHFRTELVQTTYPAPTLANVGRTAQRDTLYLEGQVDRPAETMNLTLWQGGGSVAQPQDALEIRVEGDEAYGRTGGGAWQEVDDFSGAFAPGQDLMGYLAAATEVRQVEDEGVAPLIGNYTRYAFDVDGPAFAAYLRDQLEAQLRRTGELPPGVSLDLSDEMRATTGTGEVWIDARGLPLRLNVYLRYPQQTDGRRIEAEIATDFSRFPAETLAALQTPVGRLAHAWPSRAGWQRAGQQASFFLSSLIFSLALIFVRRTRQLYAAFALVMVAILVGGPLLQSHHVHAFAEEMHEEREVEEQQREEQQAAVDYEYAMHTSDWNPSLDPLGAATDGGRQTADDAFVDDGRWTADGSSADDIWSPDTEYAIRTTNYAIRPTQTITNPQGDDDGDTLTNLQEWRLGTDLEGDDTDGDGITDQAEVQGFAGGDGQMWYLDPTDPDSDGDGLPDAMECPDLLRPSETELSAGEGCPDLDDDDIPNPFDSDSDGDGVPDSVDLSPFSARRSADRPFDEDTPLAFTLEGLKRSGARKPVLVDFQLRPQDSEHLAYAMNVLDWPTGDMEGQIQRVLETTFATDMTLEERERNPQAANGDLRLIPMLEITIPGDKPPLATTTPAMDVRWRGDISGTVHLVQQGDHVRFDLGDWSRSTRMYFKIYKGPCEALNGSWFGPFSVAAGDDVYTLQNRDLIDFADGAHAIMTYDNVAGEDRVCTTIGNVVNGPWDDKMVDPAPLEIAGVSVQEKDDGQGYALAAYVPLTMVEDDLGAARVAFAGHMVYQPKASGWGNAHEARLVWLVQMLTDVCDTTDFTPSTAAESNSDLYDLEYVAYCSSGAHRVEQSQIVHFYDDPWYLTGLDVREDYGIDLAVVHERPAGDDDFDNDDRLWTLATGLEAAFLSARTDDRGRRDFTVETIADRFDVGASSTLTETWGIPSGALDVHVYDKTDLPYQDYLAQIPMRIAPEILDSAFLSGGAAITEAPLLLLAREERVRGFNLDALGGPSNVTNQTLSFETAGVAQGDIETVAIVQWAPYRYREGAWEAYPIDEYMESVLDPRLRETFRQDTDFYDPDNDPNAEEALDIEVKAGQSIYLSYYNGLASTVKRGSQINTRFEFLQTDIGLYKWIKKGWIGATNVVTRTIFAKVTPKVISALSSAIDAMVRRMRFTSSERAIGDYVAYILENRGSYPSDHIAKQAAKISKWAKLKKAVGGAVSDGWVTLSKKLRSLWNQVKANKGMVLLAAVTAVITLVTAIVFASLGKWDIALQAVLVGVSVIILLKAIYDLVNKTGQTAATAAQTAATAGRSAANAVSKASIAAMIIGAVIAFGFFLYTWISSGVRIFSLAFNSLLAQTVAQIYVLTLMFILALNPVGAVVAAIIGVIDAIAIAVCTAIGEEATTHSVGQWFCQGLSGLATSAIKNWLYDAHDLVDMREGEDPPRLQIFGFDQDLGTPRWGLSTRNSLKFSLSVTNTIQLAHVFPTWEEMLDGWSSGERLIPVDWKSLAYGWMFNNDKLDDATFTYALQTAERDIHDSLERGDMEAEWTATESDYGKYEIVPFWIVRDVDIAGVPLDQTGINRSVSLYLSEGYALPIQECWAVPNPTMAPPGIPLYSLIPVCEMRTNAGTNQIDLGQEIHLDVFPPDLAQFYDLVALDGGYSLSWAQDGDHTFARQLDADGDGLINRRDGGADPDDSTPDTDGDGLPDFYEYEAGTPLRQPDVDGDGLDDARETRLGTSPYREDTDGDGLTDLEEVTGWEMIYDITGEGQQLRTWVTSDPLTADEDLDGFNDFLEKTYGFHPRVPSAGTILTLDSDVREATAPRLLYRFEDTVGATAFVDSSGDEHTARCTGAGRSVTRCPALVEGRYGNALSFDGNDDWVETADIATGNDFTLAFWLNPESTSNGQAFISKHGPGGGNRVVVGFRNSGYNVNIRGENYFGGTPTTGWQHIAVVAQYVGANRTEVTFYRDGDVLWQHTLDAVAGDLSGRPWSLGQEWDGDRTSDFYDGAMDEVAVFDYALSRAEVRRTMHARYNPNDLIVTPDAAFDYEAAVTNELLGRQAQGLLTTDFPTTFAGNTVKPQSFVLHPQAEALIDGQVTIGSVVPSGPISLTQVAGAIITDWREQSGFAELWLPLNEAADVTDFQDYSGVTPPRNGSCWSYRCPARQQAGYFDYGVTFDGNNDTIVLPDAETLGLKDGSFTVSAWVNAADADAAGYQAFLGTDEAATNRGLILGLNEGKLHMGFHGNGLTSDYPLVNDIWYHVVFRYDKEEQEMAIFVQGEPRVREGGHEAFQGTDTVRLGRAFGGHHFNGTLDDVRIYARALTHNEIRTLYSQPVLRMDFESSGTPGQYLDSSGFGNVAQGYECPTSYYPVSGVKGEAIYFGGRQHCELLGTILPNMNLNGSAFTWSMWLKPTGNDTYPQGILGNYLSYRTTADNNEEWEDDTWARASYPSLLRVGNKLRFGFGTGTQWRYVDTGNVLTSDQWHHVVVTFGPVYDEDGNFLRNAVKIYVDNELVKSQGVGEDAPHHASLFNFVINLGRVGEMGRVEIDSITVKDEADGSGKAELCMSWDAEEFYNEEGIEDDDGEGKTYDVSFSEIFYGDGYLRFWEDDEDHDPAGGDQCGPYPDDSDEPFGCTDDDQEKWSCGWDLDTETMSSSDTEYLFSSHTSGDLERGTWGRFTIHYDNPSFPYRGKMDELTMYKRALNAEEVQELYFSASAAMRLPLDEAPGSWSFENTVSLEGQTDAYCAGTICPTSGVRGRDNQAVLFDGVDDALTTTLTLDQSSDSPGVTLMAWVYPHSTSSGEHHVVSTAPGTGAGSNGEYAWSLLRYGDKWAFYKGSGRQTTNATVDVGQWQHIAIVYNPRSGETSFYKNGTREFHGVYGITYNTTSHPVTVGSGASGGRYFDGLIDDVRVFQGALSQVDMQTFYRNAPILLLNLDEPVDAETFADATGNGYNARCNNTGYVENHCPAAGVEGRIGTGIRFDGHNDALHGVEFDELDDFTFAAWVKPAAILDKPQPIMRLYALNGMRSAKLYLDAETLIPYVQFRHEDDYSAGVFARGETPLLLEQWNHIAVTYNRSGRRLRLYVNGYEQDRATTDLLSTEAWNLGLGYAFDESTNQVEHFAGGMDEVALYDRVLGPFEVRDIFRYQAKWVEDRQSHRVIVDDAPPVSSLASFTDEFPYQANEYQQKLIEAHDDTSGVTIVELGIRKDGQNNTTWYSAPLCLQGTAWCPGFDPTLLGGEGTYTLKTRAIDGVGRRESPSTDYVLYVDATPPDATAPIADGDLLAAKAHPTQPNTWRVSLAGTVTDPALSSGDPGSGVDTESILVMLLDSDGAPAGQGPVSVESVGDSWSVDYVLTGAPTGRYTLRVTAKDNVGNASTTDLATFSVDAAAPGAELDAREVPTGTLNGVNWLQGWVSEQTLPPNALLRLHFEEETGAERFYDSTHNGHDGVCAAPTSCPQAGATGPYGTALDFDGVNDHVVVEDSLAFTGRGFALSLWFRQDRAARSDLLVWKNASGSDEGQGYAFSVFLTPGGTVRAYLEVDGSGGLVISDGGTASLNAWHHLVIVRTGDTLVSYLDGVVGGSGIIAADLDAINEGSPLWLGSNHDSGGAPVNPFSGQMDEVALFARALNLDEIRALAQTRTSGVAQTKVAFTPALPGSPFYNDPPPAGQVLHLPFDDMPDENDLLVFADISEGSHYGACAGADCPIVQMKGHIGRAARFDGVDDTVTVNDVVPLTRTTVAAWVYPEGQNGAAKIVAYEGAPTCGFRFRLVPVTFSVEGSSDAYFVEFRARVNGTWQSVSQVQQLPSATWVHLAASYDGQTLRLYRDGQQIAETAAPGQIATCDESLVLGAGLAGRLDEVRLFDHAISASELRALYLGSMPVLHLPLDGAFAVHRDTVVDASGWQHDGTLRTPGTAANRAVAGMVGPHALNLEDGDHFITVPDSVPEDSALDLATFSVGGWIMPYWMSSRPQVLLVKGSGGDARQNYGLYVYYPNSPYGNGYLRFTFGDCTTGHTFDSTGSLNWRQWNHVMATYDGARLRLYINGALDRSVDVALVPCQDGSSPDDNALKIGGGVSSGALSPFAGHLDDVHIYPRAISALEVQALHNSRWRTASTDVGAELSPWVLPVPSGLEGVYQLDLHARDLSDHRSASEDVWRGEVDTLAPRLTLSRTLEGDFYRYTATAQDFNLTEEGLVLPCGVPLTTTRTSFEAPWYRNLTGPYSRLYEFSASCELPAWAVSGEVGAYDTPGLAHSVFLSGTNAYVSDGETGLLIFDVSDPLHPTLLASYDTPGTLRNATFAQPANPQTAQAIAGPARKSEAAVAVEPEVNPGEDTTGEVAPGEIPPYTLTTDDGRQTTDDEIGPFSFPRSHLTWRSRFGLAQGETADLNSVELGTYVGPAFVSSFIPHPSSFTSHPSAFSLPDLQATWDNMITAVEVDPAVSELDTPFGITVTVANSGTWAAVSLDLCLYVDYEPADCGGFTGRWDCTQVIGLGSGMTQSVAFSHPGFGTARIRELYAYLDPWCNDADADASNDLYGPVTITTGDVFTVTATDPAGNGAPIARNGVISTTFSRELSMSTATSRTFAVYGEGTGFYTGTYAAGSLLFDAAQDFKPGERLRFSLSDGLRAADGGTVQPHVWQARVEVPAGTGVFTPGQVLTLTGATPWPQDVALGDLDGDGDLDVIIGDDNQPSHIWINDGGLQGGTPGNFTDSGHTLGISRTHAVALGDLDGDGDLDAYLGRASTEPWIVTRDQVWFNDGTGIFTDTGQSLSDSDTCDVALGDLDGDGDLDAFVARGCLLGYTNNEIWLNRGDGVFTQTLGLLEEDQTYAVTLGDVDNDGDLDAVTGNYGWQVVSSLRLCLNDGSGDFVETRHLEEFTWEARAVALGDLDGDLDLDLVVGTGMGDPNTIWLNQGGVQGGTTGVFTTTGQTLAVSTTFGIDLGDLDGDGNLDLFAANYDEPDLVFINDGTGTFADTGQQLGYNPPPTATFSGDRSNAVALGDLDGDGDLDVFVSSPASDDGEPPHLWFNASGALAPQDDSFTLLEDSGTSILDVRANDVPFNPESLSVIAVGPAVHGTTALSGTAAVRYTPALDFNGIDTFTYTVTAGGVETGTAAVTVTLSPVNDPPYFVAGFDPTVAEDAGPQVLTGWATDIRPGPVTAPDEAGQVLTFTLTNDNVALFAQPPALDTGGTLSFTSAADAYGSAVVTATLRDSGGTADGGLDTTTHTFTITVTPVNDPPVAQDVARSTAMNAPLTLVLVPTYVSDVDGDSLIISAVGAPANGSTSTDGVSAIYTPTLSFVGIDAFTYTVRDTVGLTDTATITVTVGGVANDPPDAIDDIVATSEDMPLVIDVLANDTDPQAQILTVEAVGAATHGDALSVSNQVHYTPTADFYGTDAFIYTASDGVLTDTAMVTVTVNPVNDPPTLDAPGDIALTEDAGPQNVVLTGIGTGAANETQTLVVTAASTDTAVIPHPTVAYTSPNATGSLSFTPVPDAFGHATVVVTVTDGLSATVRSFRVTLTPVNDPPTLDPLPNLALHEDPGEQILDLTGIGMGASNEGQTLNVSAISGNSTLIPTPTVTYASPDPAGTLRFNPATDAHGTTVISVTVSDGLSQTLRAFQVDITPVNDAPTLTIEGLTPFGTVTVPEDSPTHTLTLSNITSGAPDEGQTLTVTATTHLRPYIVPDPTIAYASPDTTGTLAFRPGSDEAGSSGITVRVSDGLSETVKTFSVIVTQINDPPSLNAIDDLIIDEDVLDQTIYVSGINDPEDNGYLSVTAVSTNTALIPNPTVEYYPGSYWHAWLHFTPVADQWGEARIHVTVRDPSGAEGTESFTVTVNPANDPPTLDPLPDLVVDAGAGPQQVALSGIGTGAPNEAQTLTVTARSSDMGLIPHPGVSYASPSPTGTLTFDPLDRGHVTLVVTVTDGVDAVAREFDVTVLPSGVEPYLYVADDYPGGLRIYEMTGPTALHLTGVITEVVEQVPGWGIYVHYVDAQDVVARGGYAYVAGVQDGLWVMDVIDPAHPRYLAQLSPSGAHNAVAVALSGNILYLVDNLARELWLVDVTYPDEPVRLGVYTVSCFPHDVEVYGDHVFLADQCGLRVLDVSNPADPQQVAFLTLSGARSINLVGSTAYVGTGAGLAIVNVLDPLHPTLIRRFSTPGQARVADTFVADLEGEPQTMACVADFNQGLRIINTNGIPEEEATACDTSGNCGTVSLSARQILAGVPSAQDPLETMILSPDPILASTDPVSITGQARALSSTLRSLDVTVDGTTIYTASWATGTLSETSWATTWAPPGEGRYALRAEVIDWVGNPVEDALTVLVDTHPPTFYLASTVFTRTHYRSPRSIMLTGALSDTGGVEDVQITADSGGRIDADVKTSSWRAPWYLGPGALPDGETFTLNARATDVVGHRSTLTETVLVDLVPPSEVDATLLPTQPLIRTPGAPLTLTWGAATDGSGLSGYEVVWQAADALSTTATVQSFSTSAARQATFTAGEAQRISVDLVTRDVHGNARRQEAGSCLVDGPLTPDYIPVDAQGHILAPHWQGSGCTLLGVDRRAVYLGEQRLYTTWDRQALRVAWTGASWNTDGDLFVTLDTAPGGTTTAFNPYTDTADIILPASMEADAVIWVQDDATAELWQWDGAAWTFEIALAPDYFVATGDRTDLILPFDLLGIADPTVMPLSLLAFASEEASLALWATLPAANGISSDTAAPGEDTPADITSPLSLDHVYHWDTLGDGICPNGSDGSLPVRYADTDLHLSLDVAPAGVTYSLLDDGLFWLRDLLESAPADVTSYLDFMATAHPPLGHGQPVSYTFRFENRGTVTATGVIAELTARYALRLPGGTTVALGDVGPGERGNVTVQGIIDTTASPEPWAALEARIYDDDHPTTGAPLEWLWANHAVDRAAPAFYGIHEPARYIGVQEILLQGYAFDEAGIAALTLGIDSPSGGSAPLICNEGAPWQGGWSCLWDVVASNGGSPPVHGEAFTLYLQATDIFGQAGAWSAPYNLIVDTQPPTLTLGSDVRDGDLLSDANFTLSGEVVDEAGVESVEFCVAGRGYADLCEPVRLQPDNAPAMLSYADIPETPEPLGATTACGGAALERTFTVNGEITLGAVRLGFAAAHTHRDDLRVTLTSPDGTVITLLDDDGLSGTALADYDLLLSDAAASFYAAPVAGDVTAPRYDRAARPLAPLDAFRGENGHGTWTLTICDADPGANDGAYLSSRLILVPETTVATTGRWSYEHSEAGALDYVSRTLSLYATDGVGNRGQEHAQPPSITLWIDTVPPVLTVTQSISVVAGQGDAALSGFVTDGGEVRAVRATVETPSGRRYDDIAARDGDAWSLTLADDLALALPGEHRIWLTALDLAGNSVTWEPVTVNVVLPPATSPPQDIYLTLVGRNDRVRAPDFLVQRTEDSVLGTDVMLVLENAGNVAATEAVRVDLYFDGQGDAPSHAPEEGEVWDVFGIYGAHWIIPATQLPGPGETLTLRLADAVQAHYPPNFTGMLHAYVRVDTLDAVAESDEDNNLLQIDLPDLDGPDLVITDLVATPDNVQVVIQNVGEGQVTEPFWVDLYVDPQSVPTQVNQIWEDLAEQGGVWGVTEEALPLRTGDTLTLTIGGTYFWVDYSQLEWPLAVGTPIYVQVDSANAGTPYGGVLEYHELVGEPYNNIVSTTVRDRSGISLTREDGAPTGELHRMPPRH